MLFINLDSGQEKRTQKNETPHPQWGEDIEALLRKRQPRRRMHVDCKREELFLNSFIIVGPLVVHLPLEAERINLSLRYDKVAPAC